MKFIPDHEIDLQEYDILKTGFYAGLLENIILDTDTTGFVNIGLVGEWGSGKSSIIKTVQKKLTFKKEIAFVVYDAWKYSNDSFRRMFLISLREQLELEETSHFKSFYKNIGQDISVKQTTSLSYLVYVTGLFLVLYFFVLKDLFPKSDQLYAATITIVGMMLTIMGRAIIDLKTTQTQPYLFAPEQFEDCFKELVNGCLNRNNGGKRKKWAKRPKNYPAYRKLVIVIDNLDRCQKEMAFELLSVLKNFLSNHPNVVFIVPFDEDALHKHINNKPSASASETQEFMRKIFSVMVRIKPFRRFDLYDFTQSLNNKYALYFQPTTVDIISKEYASNPRRIIQFCNSLCAELEGFSIRFSKDFSGKYQSMICKALLLREEWPEFYKELCNNPNLLSKPDNVIKSPNDRPNSLNNFLMVTDFVGRDIEYTVLDQIFSITDRNGKLPPNIIEAILQKDILSLRHALANKLVDERLLVTGLIEMLHTAIQREIYDTEVKNLFELLCRLNQLNPLTESEHEMIETETKPKLFHFVEKISDLDALCNYALSDSLLALPYLRNHLLMLIEGGLSDKQKSERHVYLRQLLNAYTKYSRKNEESKLSSIFLADYENNNTTLEGGNFDSDVLQALCSEELLKRIFGKISKFGSEDNNFSDTIYLLAKIKIPESSIQKLYEGFNILFEQPNFIIPSTLTNFLSLLEMQPILETSPAVQAIQEIFNHFLWNDEFLNISFTMDMYPNTTEIAFEMSRISNGKVNIIPFIEKLVNFHEDFKKIIINKIHSKLRHPAIPFLAPFILNLYKFNTDKETMEILQDCIEKFSQNNTVPPAEITTVFSDLLLIYIVKGPLPQLDRFFEYVYSIPELVGMLTAATLNFADRPIDKLPHILHPVILNSISNNMGAFWENIGALKNLALWGTQEDIAKLPPFIIKKLQNDKSENVLQILCYLNSASHEEIELIANAFNELLDEPMKRSGMTILESLQQVIMDPDKPRLKINTALYYTDRNNIDVTAVLNAKISSNRLNETANNDLAGDPEAGTAKKLLVEYTYNGYHLKCEVNEHEQLILP